ncbi:MAG TPA: radical SAM protein, partial [Opitutaceae bacterium]|nr:radical SAM protein [Opitutaceae bacterium]
MSVRNCLNPWQTLLIANDGRVMPCCHGSKAVGDINLSSVEEIWNGVVMQGLRASILEGRVHDVCQSSGCPYQKSDEAFPDYEPMAELDPEFCSSFDESHYLQTHPDVAAAVSIGVLGSGLEHYYRHGSSEGRAFQLRLGTAPVEATPSFAGNIVERTARKTVIRSQPTDVVLAVTTVCNLRCVMCPHGMGLVDSPSHMPARYADKLDALVKGAARIILSGVGEPTLAPSFWWFIDAERFPSRAYTRVNSNAHFITPGNAVRLVRSNLSEISISLDAASGPTYRRIRGGNFRKALRGILNLVKARSDHAKDLKIYVNMTLMRENLGEAVK